MKVIDAYQNNIHLKVKMVKLFLFKARDAPIVVIVRQAKVNSYKNWELIRWDLQTDTFQTGQWLKCAHIIRPKYFSISPDGNHLAYCYTNFETNEHFEIVSHMIISKVPYFTATMYTKDHGVCGHGTYIGFNTHGQPMCRSSVDTLEVRQPTTLKEAKWESNVPTGYIESGTFTDSKGRVITLDKGRIMADGVVLYDTTDHVFQSIPYPMEDFPSAPHSHPYFTRSKAVHATK